MKKFFNTIFASLGIILLFASCGIIPWEDILSPIDTIYLFTIDDNGNEVQSATMAVGDYTDFEFEIVYYSETYETCEVELFSSDESVAKTEWSSGTVNTTGDLRVYAVGEGECTITLRSKLYQNEYATVSITVTPAKTIKLAKHELTLKVGQGEKLSYTNYYNSSSVYWSSSSSYYVTVDQSGYVKGIRKGSATVTVESSDGKKSDTCKVTVIDTSGWNVTISNGYDIPNPFYPNKGEESTYKLECIVNVDSGIDEDVTWRSEDSSIVSVNSDTGLITARAAGTTNIYAELTADNTIKDSIQITVSAPPTPANEFFWGKWSRMDSGEVYTVEETYVLYNDKKYDILSSSDSELVINELGSFVKDTDNVIKWHDSTNDIDIPFYRQGGKDLKYKVRVVGFEDAIADTANSNILICRAAGTEDLINAKGKSGIKVKGQSERYTTYSDEAQTDEDGYVELTAPVQGDSQTLTITDDDGEITVVSGLKIENSDDFMGTIPLVKKDEYSLKITGDVDPSEKTNGYLYANNYKTYPLTLSISNISEIKSETAIASISCSDSNVTLSLSDSSEYTLDGITISSMKAGATKTINLEIAYGTLTSSYKDVELNIKVENLETKRVWVDYVPLRFFAGDMPITITGDSTEDNSNAALHGFVIYPDGNSKFFSVNNKAHKTLYVPIFGAGNKYEMVFSGATVTGQLSASTEMYYTVAFDSNTSLAVNKGAEETKIAYSFGEKNNSEATAYDLTAYFAENNKTDFQAYLKEGDIDFYLFEAESDSTVVIK